jgi:hypothetical protein
MRLSAAASTCKLTVEQTSASFSCSTDLQKNSSNIKICNYWYVDKFVLPFAANHIINQGSNPSFAMSGAEAALILGLITASISLINTAKTLYDTAHDAKGLPPAFKEVAGRMPLVLEILRKAEGQLNDKKVKESTCKAVQPVVEQCKLKSRRLQDLFKKVLPGEDAGIG